MKKPDFITFTGLDERTDLARVASLSGRYPIEWAVLFSRNRQGLEPRYPATDVIDRILAAKDRHGFRAAAHLCGKYAQDVMEGHFDRSILPLGGFDRIQVNHVKPEPAMLRRFAVDGQTVIAQWRDPDMFPTEYLGVDWLYDPSGGRGIAPGAWPENNGDRSVGYAGGIGPDTVASVVDIVSRRSPNGYWLDMETSIRRDDYLDLDRVERVLTAVYGG